MRRAGEASRQEASRRGERGEQARRGGASRRGEQARRAYRVGLPEHLRFAVPLDAATGTFRTRNVVYPPRLPKLIKDSSVRFQHCIASVKTVVYPASRRPWGSETKHPAAGRAGQARLTRCVNIHRAL